MRLTEAFGVAGLLAMVPSIPHAQAPDVRLPRFEEVGAASGLAGVTVAATPPWKYIIDNIGTGIALLDYDLDEDLDIFQVQASALAGFPGPTPTDHLYRNDGRGRFQDVTAEAGVIVPGWGFGVAVGDYDNVEKWIAGGGLNGAMREAEDREEALPQFHD